VWPWRHARAAAAAAGHLDLESGPSGTTVRAAVPLSNAAAATDPALSLMNRLRILLADDHEMLRKGLRATIEGHRGWEICGEARTGERP